MVLRLENVATECSSFQISRRVLYTIGMSCTELMHRRDFIDQSRFAAKTREEMEWTFTALSSTSNPIPASRSLACVFEEICFPLGKTQCAIRYLSHILVLRGVRRIGNRVFAHLKIAPCLCMKSFSLKNAMGYVLTAHLPATCS